MTDQTPYPDTNPPGGPDNGNPLSQANVLTGLFDFGFSKFITTRTVSIIYILGMGVIGLISVVLFIGGLASGEAMGILLGLLAPLIGLIYAIMLRLWLEFLVVQFRQLEVLSKIAEK